MKKIVLALVVLMFAAPAWAQVVNITCAQVGDTNEVIVSFDARDYLPDLVRAFGLNIQLNNDAKIIEVVPTMAGVCTETEKGYGIFPGTIVITGNMVTYDGTPVGEEGDSPDTLPGIDSNGVTVEIGSLYAPTGPGSPNAPDPCGPMLSFFVSADTCITISGNVARAGSGGVVMEDPDQVVTVDATAGCCVVIGQPVCVGDVDDNSFINKFDIVALVNYLVANASAPFWTVPSTNPAYSAAADVDSNGFVNKFDIVALVNYLVANASAPFWTVPCP